MKHIAAAGSVKKALTVLVAAALATATPLERRSVPDFDPDAPCSYNYVTNDGRPSCNLQGLIIYCGVPHQFLIQDGHLYFQRMQSMASEEFPAESWGYLTGVMGKVSRSGLHEDDVFVKVLNGALVKEDPTPVYRRLFAMVSRNDVTVVKYLEYTTSSPPIDGAGGPQWHELKSFEGYTVPIRDIAVAQHETGHVFLVGIPDNMTSPALFLMDDNGETFFWDFNHYSSIVFPSEDPLKTISVPPLVQMHAFGKRPQDVCIAILDIAGHPMVVSHDGSAYHAYDMGLAYDPDEDEIVPVTLVALTIHKSAVAASSETIDHDLEYLVGVTQPTGQNTFGYVLVNYRDHTDQTTWHHHFNFVNIGNPGFAKLTSGIAVPALRRNVNTNTMFFGLEMEIGPPVVATSSSSVWPPDFGPNMTIPFLWFDEIVHMAAPAFYGAEQTKAFSICQLDFRHDQPRQIVGFMRPWGMPMQIVHSDYCHYGYPGDGYMRDIYDIGSCEFLGGD